MAGSGSWTAVVPVKAWSSAKSRFGLPGDARSELARAMTLDTLDVLTSHPQIGRVIVVTSDAAVAAKASASGCAVVEESYSADPLNDAVRLGCAAVTGDGPVVVVPADLAYLSVDVLTSTLAVLAGVGSKAHVPDRAGTGTTLLAAARASDVNPHYGPGSSALHAVSGFQRCEGVDPRARADIDALDDLSREPSWTPGPRVADVVDRLVKSAS